MIKANNEIDPVTQLSILFWLDHDGNLTLSRRLSLEARSRAGGNFDHRSVMDVLIELEGGDIAAAYQLAAVSMVDTINASSREDAEKFYSDVDMDTVLHLRPLGLCGGASEMEARGLFDYIPRPQEKRF